MKVGAVPWYGALVAAGLTAAWGLHAFDWHRFEDPKKRRLNEPQLKDGESRLGRVMALGEPGDLEPGVLVEFELPRTGRPTVSRVAAVAGQRVALRAGELLVDGSPADDSFGLRRGPDELPEHLVPEGCVFVLNDLRTRDSAEFDSRSLGPIPVRAITLWFPPKEKRRR